MAGPDAAAERPMATAGAEPTSPEALQLDVSINGRQIGLIGEFVLRDGDLFAKHQELLDLGLRVPPEVAPARDDLIALTALPGVAARFDLAAQTVSITAPPEALLTTVLRPPSSPGSSVPLRSSVGATLNYDLVGGATRGNTFGAGLFEFRGFSPVGIASTNFIARGGTNPNAQGQNGVTRLDSTYVYSNFNAEQRYWLGDFITSGLLWTRPVRLGGAQITHDFTMRPDLVTFPLPTLAGSVAVPSTVNVLVNGTQTLSREVPPGPFEVQQLPVITGAGTVQLQVVNALGQQVTTTQPFYASARLLAPGLDTWSFETGWLRLDWGLASNHYGVYAASGTYRRGLTDALTIEAHGEGAKGQVMAGGAIVANAFDFAVVQVGAAGSVHQGRPGGQLVAGFRRIGPKFSFGASAILATDDFRDVAAVNGDPVPLRQTTADIAYSLGRWGQLGVAWTHIDRPAGEVPASAIEPPAHSPTTGSQPAGEVETGSNGLGFPPAEDTRLLTASYSVELFHTAYLFANVFHDFAPGGGQGASLGVTIPLGRRTSVGASGGHQTGSSAYGQVQIQQSATNVGELGYQAYFVEGAADHDFGQLMYKSPWALLTAGADRLDAVTTYRLEAQGALSFTDHALFASNTVYQSFAVVDTDVPGVHVQFENRPEGVTNAHGRLLVPDLLSWDVNRISIDPADVPVDAQVPSTEQQVRPPDRSGVVVKFPIRKTNGALLVLVDETGHPLPLGSSATLKSTGIEAAIGYDGEAFIEGLAQHDQLIVQLPDGARCGVSFDYAPVPGEIPKIGPLTCRKDEQ